MPLYSGSRSFDLFYSEHLQVNDGWTRTGWRTVCLRLLYSFLPTQLNSTQFPQDIHALLLAAEAEQQADAMAAAAAAAAQQQQQQGEGGAMPPPLPPMPPLAPCYYAERMRTEDYLFRYDRGAFWLAQARAWKGLRWDGRRILAKNDGALTPARTLAPSTHAYNTHSRRRRRAAGAAARRPCCSGSPRAGCTRWPRAPPWPASSAAGSSPPRPPSSSS